jgi:hypothetical protein
MAALAWPSMIWTAFTFAPAAIARLAALCRSSCGTRPGTPLAVAARSQLRRRNPWTRSTSPRCEVNWRSSGDLPAMRTATSSRMNLGTATQRSAWVLGEPKIALPLTSLIASAMWSRRAPGATRPTRIAASSLQRMPVWASVRTTRSGPQPSARNGSIQQCPRLAGGTAAKA